MSFEWVGGLAISVGACAALYALCRAYRKSTWLYGSPSAAPTDIDRPSGYRAPSETPLGAYHAAYLVNPTVQPGLVAGHPLIAEGVIRLEQELSAPRACPGQPKPGLDPFQQAAADQARGVPLHSLTVALSKQIAPTVAAEVEGTRVQCPAGGRGLPRAATRALWLMAVGASSLILGLGGGWGWLSACAIELAYRADRARGFAPGLSLSEAGWLACRQLEWDLDRRCEGTAPDDYPVSDVALYLALKPLPHGRIPKLDWHFVYVPGPESEPGATTSIGPRLSNADSAAARRTNRRRMALVYTAGFVVLFGCLYASLRYGFASQSWVYWLNGSLCVVALAFSAIRIRLRKWTGYIRDSGALLPTGHR